MHLRRAGALLAAVIVALPCAATSQTPPRTSPVTVTPAELEHIAPASAQPAAAARPRGVGIGARIQQPNNPTIKGPSNVHVDVKAIQAIREQAYLQSLGNALDAALKKHAYVGYALTIVMPSGASMSRVDGMARRSPDEDPRKITADDKISIASSSKTITAATLMSILTSKNISIDSPVYPYLPSSWALGPNVKTITFHQLLTHYSGIRCGDITYTGLRSCVAAGINLGDKSVWKYENVNFAMFRVIIPRVRGVFTPGVDAFLTARETAGDTNTPALAYARAYVVAVNELTFRPIGFPWMYCAPTGAYPAMSYESAHATSIPTPPASPNPEAFDFSSVNPGEIWGDMTLSCGSQGWQLSSKQLAAFMHELQTGSKIVPANVAQMMRDQGLGMYHAPVTAGLSEWDHNGYHPAYFNKGEIHTLMMYFSNGVTLGLIINSPFGPDNDFYTPIRAAVASVPG